MLQQNDMLFLDDCLYSQYVFLLKNIDALKDKNIACVLGFSTSIFRREDRLPIYDAHCAEFHNRVHSGDEPDVWLDKTGGEYDERSASNHREPREFTGGHGR